MHTLVAGTCIAQAQALASTRQYGMAEGVFLRAKRPEGALAMYRGAGLWADALRIAGERLLLHRQAGIVACGLHQVHLLTCMQVLVP